jgi:hypothetical protein
LFNLDSPERQTFDNAITLYSSNDEVREHNISMLEIVGHPVARVEAVYYDISKDEGSKINSDVSSGLEDVLHLSVGSRVHTYIYIDANDRSC